MKRDKVSKGKILYRYLVVLFFVFILFFRFSFISNGGAFAEPDELRYLQSISAIENLFKGNLSNFCFNISSAHCRPGDVIRNLVPASIQYMALKIFGLDALNPDSLLIPLFFNVIISVFLSFFIFKISFLVFNKDYPLSLTATIVYSILVNNNFYIRHLLPYDMSLLCFIIAIFLIIERYKRHAEFNKRLLFGVGALSTFGFMVYPGYYFLFIFVFFLFIILSHRIKEISEFYQNLKIIAYQCFIYIIPFVLSIFLFDVLAHIGKTFSYTITCLVISSTITQGSYEESFIFLLKYLVDVENVIGSIVLMGVVSYLICLILSFFFKRKNKFFNIFIENRLVVFLFISGVVGYLLHATLGYFGFFVFYGRILHQYLPFFVLGSVFFIHSLASMIKKRNVIMGVLIVISLFSFFSFYLDFKKVSYPRDVLYKMGFTLKNERIDYTSIEEDIQKNRLMTVIDFENAPLQYIVETPPHNCFMPPQKSPFKKDFHYKKKDYKFINFCFFYPIDKPAPKYNMLMNYYRKLKGKHEISLVPDAPQPFRAYIPEEGWETIFERPHFLLMKPYMYEGLSIEGRRLLKERAYKIKILKKK